MDDDYWYYGSPQSMEVIDRGLMQPVGFVHFGSKKQKKGKKPYKMEKKGYGRKRKTKRC